MGRRNYFLLLVLLCCCASQVSGSFTSEVFIATARRRHHALPRSGVRLGSSIVNTATDAAIAINSIEFMELLSGIKNTAQIKTYTQASARSRNVGQASASSKEQSDESSTSWGWLFGGGNSTSSGDDMLGHSSNHDCQPVASGESKSNRMASSSCVSHETVSEYLGQLWFLPDKRGIQFRERIRVITISEDGMSSTVECTTQYHNGSRWVDCSRVICEFESMPFDMIGTENGAQQENIVRNDAKVKMTLKCEVLVWLPLPKAASNAVGKKISSVFEAVALDFFEELASNEY